MMQYFHRRAVVYEVLPEDRMDQLHDKCGKRHNNRCNRCKEFLLWQTYLAHRKVVHSSPVNFCIVYFRLVLCNTSHKLLSYYHQAQECIGMILDRKRDKWNRCIPDED